MFDSLIFDMDGTLWDAVDSYAEVWNVTSHEFGVGLRVDRNDLLLHMGKTIDVIFNELMNGVNVDPSKYLERLDYNESFLMPRLGGKLYPGVKEGIKFLSQRYRLFMISNCGADGVRNMLSFTGLTPYFEGTLTHGETGRGKDCNIAGIVETFCLRRPLYIGDTQGDCNAAHAAGVPMGYASWGFGECHDAELRFANFDSMTNYLMSDK